MSETNAAAQAGAKNTRTLIGRVVSESAPRP